jgi:excisionase family DNA binding protein
MHTNRTARPAPKARSPTTLLNTAGAMAYLGISKTILRNYIRDGKISPIRLGPKLLRFDPDDLDRLLSR